MCRTSLRLAELTRPLRVIAEDVENGAYALLRAHLDVGLQQAHALCDAGQGIDADGLGHGITSAMESAEVRAGSQSSL